MKPSPPNFLWISLEDCSPRFGCYGDPLARTPNIDRLATEGTLFGNAFCSAPVSSPSRTTVITGFPATAMAAHHMRTTYVAEDCPALPTPYHAVPPPFVKCFTELLRSEGYYCSNNGKTDYQFEAPFLAWDANAKPATLAEIHWRNRPDRSQPFFSVFNLEDTHESRMWPDRPLQLEPDLAPRERTDPLAVVVPPYLPDAPEVRRTLARQYDNIAHNDRLVGKLLAQLEEDGLAENTLVMLWSDHGEGLPRAKRFLYDSGLRVPLIIRAPDRFAAGVADDRMVSLTDLAPTVFDCVGLPKPLHFTGQSLLDRSAKPRRFVFAHRDRLDGEYDKARCVRSAKFKLIRNYYPGQERFGYVPYRSRHQAMCAIRQRQLDGDDSFDSPAAPLELYDLERDPHELRNLAHHPDFATQRRELEEALDAWQTRYDPDLHASEEAIVERCWPGRRQPPTATPIAIVHSRRNLEGSLVEGACEVSGQTLLQFHCATEGASIGYRYRGSSEWLPYRRALRLGPGSHAIEVRALRYGYALSDVRAIEVSIFPDETVHESAKSG